MIDHDASPEDARRAAKSGKKTVLDVPPEAIEKEHKALQQEHGPGDHEANAVKRVAAKMIRQSSAIGGRIIGKRTASSRRRRRSVGGRKCSSAMPGVAGSASTATRVPTGGANRPSGWRETR